MRKSRLTELGKLVDKFISDASNGPEGPEKDIGRVLLEVLADDRIASKLGLAVRERGRPSGKRYGVHASIATDYLIELHLRGGKARRGAATAAAAAVCERHSIDERQLRAYRRDTRLSAYIRYRLAVNEGEFGLTGEPNIPADVDDELRQLAESLKNRTINLADLLS